MNIKYKADHNSKLWRLAYNVSFVIQNEIPYCYDKPILNDLRNLFS